MSELRIYSPDECGANGYPFAWSQPKGAAIKELIREQAGHRCVRCGHPYRCGESPAEWSPCDVRCTHKGPIRVWVEVEGEPGCGHWWETEALMPVNDLSAAQPIEALRRVLTTHHLNGDKADCRWWNLAALCQRCHLTIQGRVRMEQVYPHEHSDWFKPYAAGYYAATYLDEDLTREETVDRLEELLALELAA